MASASRAFALRSSLRAAASRQTPQLARPAARRGYASAHGAAEKSSDLPWLITSVAITVPAVAWLMSGKKSGGSSHGSAHHSGAETPSGAPISPDDEAPAVEPSGDKKSSSDRQEIGDDSKGSGDDQAPKKEGNPQAGQSNSTGRAVPPPSADNASIAEKWDEKKEGHEEYKEKSRAGETKVFSASSDAPSKKKLSEDPSEDPQKGEGEGAQKGGPSSE